MLFKSQNNTLNLSIQITIILGYSMRRGFSRLCSIVHRIVCSAMEPSEWHAWNAARGCMWRGVVGARVRMPPLVCFEDRLSKLLAYALYYLVLQIILSLLVRLSHQLPSLLSTDGYFYLLTGRRTFSDNVQVFLFISDMIANPASKVNI